MMSTVAVCVPSIPVRRVQLAAALRTVAQQSRLPEQIHVEVDVGRTGAAATRNRVWRRATTDWIAFLDDDDELMPDHLETLLEHADDGVDLVYSWFDLPEAEDPLAVLVDGVLRSPFGVEFGPEQRDYLMTRGNFIPVTVLVRRGLLEDVDGFPTPGTERWPDEHCEDWGCWRDMLQVGATFRHVPRRTWTWHHHGRNTSGRNDRW
jgi:glycosyltransferase involved in cell wall biosynthesis